jgi:hypothetical protein
MTLALLPLPAYSNRRIYRETHPRTILRGLGFLRPRNHRSFALASATTPVDEKQSDPRRMVRECDSLGATNFLNSR